MIAILEKLERDKFIFQVSNGSYHITLEGKIFEGYVQRQKDKIADKKNKDNYDARMESNAHRLTIGTWFLVGSTLIFALVEILKHK